MLALTPRGAELELHVNLLRHGRRTCHAQTPGLRGLRAAADVPRSRRRARAVPVVTDLTSSSTRPGAQLRRRPGRRRTQAEVAITRVDPPDGALEPLVLRARSAATHAWTDQPRTDRRAQWQAWAERRRDRGS